MKTTLQTRILALLVILVGVLPSACSSDETAQNHSAPGRVELASTYGITAYVAAGDDVKTLVFGQQATPPAEVEQSSSALKTLDLGIDTDAGAAPSIPTTQSTNGMKDLARMALSECGLRGAGSMGAMRNYYQSTKTGSCVGKQLTTRDPYTRTLSTSGQFLIGTTWAPADEPSCVGLETSNANPFLFFYYEPKTAAQVIQYEETLVCAASKLAELAEADKPIQWPSALHGLGWANAAGALETLSVDLAGYVGGRNSDIIPPAITFKVVQPKDRFLVRDLAMELLSYVPLLDQFPIQVGTTYWTTSNLLANAGTTTFPAAGPQLYNVATAGTVTATNAGLYYPPIEWNTTSGTADWPKTARRHLEMETANLRAAGQLMQELVEKNVYGALGGALQKAAQLPPAERARSLWQNTTDANSIAEVSRNLFGRLGTLGMVPGAVTATNPVPSLRCRPQKASVNWVKPESVWAEYGPLSMTARGNDLARRNNVGVQAESLLTAARFVPSAATNAATLRTEVYNRNRDVLAAASNKTPTAFEATTFGLRFKDQVDRLTDESLRTAAIRQQTTFSTLSNKPGTSQTNLGFVGLTATPTANGFTLDKEIERGIYEGDLMGALFDVQLSSECTGTGTGTSDFLNINTVINGDPLNGASSPGRVVGSPFTPRMRSYQFQDAFAVGQAIRDRLVRLREYTRLLTTPWFGTTADEDVKARAGALFEVDAWAGSTRVIVRPHNGTQQTVVSLFDVDPKEYGLSDSPTTSELAAAFALAIFPSTPQLPHPTPKGAGGRDR